MSSRLMFVVALVALASLSGSHTSAQGRGAPEPLPAGQTNDPFPQPIVRDEGVITVTLREFASLPDIAGVAARMMTLVEEPATRRLFVSDMRGLLYAVSRGRQDGDAVPRSPRSEVGRRRAVAGPRARDAELRAPPAVRPGRHAGIRQALHLHGQLEPDAGAGLHDAEREHHARHRAARMDGEDAGRGGLRRRGAARADPAASAVRQSQRRRDRVQSDGASGHRRLRPPVHGHRRRRQRRRPDEARAEPRLGVRQDLPHRPARQERPRRQVRDPRRESVRVDGGRPAGDLRVWRPQCAALRLGFEERRDVHVRHRPEHRRGSEPGDRRREPRLERLGGQLPVRQPARR